VRIALVGTELAPARVGAGALETLLDGWATALAAAGDEVHLIGSPGTAVGVATAVTRHELARHPAGLDALIDSLAPDVVVLDNRPGWQEQVRAPTLQLLHNWPDAWELAGRDPVGLVGRAGVAAVSGALAAAAASALGRDRESVAVVDPFVGDAFTRIDADPTPGWVLAPNRLLTKKGVRQLVAASHEPVLAAKRIGVTDFLSPWTLPTGEHRELRAVVAGAPRCELVPPPATREAMAALVARAEVVVVPSIGPEGFGMVAAEAQAVGVPVVSSGLGGLAEATLSPGRTVDPCDAPALAEAIVAAAGVGSAARLALRTEARGRWSLGRSLCSLRAAIETARPS
jgi:glycosyltransferase involved in cell wall biosynthesis